MKIVDSEIILKEEKMLFHSLNGIIDLSIIKENFKNNHNLEISSAPSFINGDLISCNNQINFQLNFIVPIKFSVIINRKGNCMGFMIKESSTIEINDDAESEKKMIELEVIKRREKEILNAIAGALDKQRLKNHFININKFEINNDIDFKDGEIIIYDEEVSYLLNFVSEIKFGIQIDKKGKLKKIGEII